MTANGVYQLMLFAAAKNLSDGYISPDDFNNVLMPMAQNSYFDYLRGEYQRYQIKRPVAVVEFSQNQMIRQSLAPLVYGTVLSIDNTTGIASFPYNFEYVDAMWGIYGNKNIRFVQQDRLDSYLRDPIDPVAENPIYLIQYEGFNFFPANPYGYNNAKISYIRKPPPIIWGYTLDINGLPVYDASTSSDPVWSDSDIYQVIIRALALIGVNLQLPVLMQYSESIKQGGA